jgi:hypothetical protein
VLPVVAAAPIEIEDPEQMDVFAMVVAAGKAFTVMVTALELLHPVEVLVSVNVYVVVIVGLTVGLEEVEENPEGELTHA